jgi:FixJ family two-component response regulator
LAASWIELPLLPCMPPSDYPRWTVEQLDPVQKQVAQGKLGGREKAEIARQLGCSERAVERKRQVIRRIWGENP